MTRLIRLIPLTLAILIAVGCATQRPPVIVPPVVVPAIAILTVEVEPKAATVKVGDRSWATRPDGTIVEEFTAGETFAITVLAPGYIPQTRDVAMTAGRMTPVRIVLERVPPPPVPSLTVRGRQFFDGDRLYIPRWVSGLTLLVRTPEQQDAFLDWAAKTGFNGVRVFAGALTWAGQTPEGARSALPALLDKAAARGLTVEVTAITDSATGYDAREHVRLLAGLLTNRRGVVFELANEVGHPSQSPEITEPRMRQWGAEILDPLGIVWAVGASSVDEPCPRFEDRDRNEITRQAWESLPADQRNDRPAVCGPYDPGVYPAHGGRYNTAHLDRTSNLRQTWNVWRRVREIFAITESHGNPTVNNEPEGCAEPGTRGQRYFDPAFAFAAGALDRAFGVGGVHHSQAGLMAELPGPVQQQCAEAYVAAHAAVESVLPGVVGQYKNVGHAGGPLSAARFVEGGSGDGVVRAYSFISGNRGVSVLIGARGELGLVWANGWRQVKVIAERTAQDGRAVVVLEIGR
jgi:hypothetical protein